MAATATKRKKPGTALAGFKTGAMMPRKPIKSGGGDAFIWTAHPMSKAIWADMSKKFKGLQEAQLVYVSGSLSEILQPMKFHLIEAFHFYATDDQGEITKTWSEEAENRPKEAKEYVEALLVVYTSKGAKPATIRTKNAMCKILGPMLQEYADASEPAWASRSKEYANAAKNVSEDLIGFRFYGTASAAPKPTKDGKGTFPNGSVQVSPSTSTEFLTLKEIDEEFQAALESSRQSFLSRVSDIKSMYAK